LDSSDCEKIGVSFVVVVVVVVGKGLVRMNVVVVDVVVVDWKTLKRKHALKISKMKKKKTFF